MRLACDNCGTEFLLGPVSPGGAIKCPKCGDMVPIPSSLLLVIDPSEGKPIAQSSAPSKLFQPPTEHPKPLPSVKHITPQEWPTLGAMQKVARPDGVPPVKRFKPLTAFPTPIASPQPSLTPSVPATKPTTQVAPVEPPAFAAQDIVFDVEDDVLAELVNPAPTRRGTKRRGRRAPYRPRRAAGIPLGAVFFIALMCLIIGGAVAWFVTNPAYRDKLAALWMGTPETQPTNTKRKAGMSREVPPPPTVSTSVGLHNPTIKTPATSTEEPVDVDKPSIPSL